MQYKSLCMIGLGYIGLPTAAVFASRKIKVVGVDINQQAVDIINKGEIHIVEPDLDIAVHSAVKEGYLRATTTPEPSDAFIVAVPTPFLKGEQATDTPTPDLSYIKAAAKAIAPVLEKGNLVILESTSPVGATEKMAAWIAEERPDLSFPQDAGEASDIMIAHCPERVLPGRIMHELIENDRVVGGMTPRCARAACDLYKAFVQGDCLLTTARTAGMAKLTENAFRDVNIAFANELSMICDKMDINVWELISLANRHPRVNILQPGPGVGGHCIAVDPWFIVSKTPEEARLIRTARDVNDSKPEWVIEKAKLAVADYLQANPDKTAKDVTIACYGIAFKPDIDDLRESPALKIVEEISTKHPGKVLVVEPNVTALPVSLASCRLVGEPWAVTADVHLMLVDHKLFTKTSSPNGITLDCRGVWQCNA